MTAPLDVLRESLSNWRKTKHPRFADLAEWSTARALAAEAQRPVVGLGKKKADAESWRAVLGGNDPLDLPRLVKAIGGGTSNEAVERITLLSKLNDPRVVTGLLELLGAPPYRARTAINFFRTAAKVLGESGDPRVRPALEDLAARYKSILETNVGDDVAALLARTAKALDQVKPGPLPAALEKKATAFEALFEAERTQVERGAVKQRAAKHDDDALLAAIYAAPDDDTPRLVFADALTERGDVRGEFIALQLNRARGKATPAQIVRERELIRDPKIRAAWCLPLSRGAICGLRRGFSESIMLEPRTFKTITGNAALRTVHSVNGFERTTSLRQATSLLTHESAARVTMVSSLEQELLESFPAPLKWSSVGVQFVPGPTHRAHLANVRELKLKTWGITVTPGAFEPFAHLEKVLVGNAEAGAFTPLLQLTELTALGWMENYPWAKELDGAKKLRKLHMGSVPTPGEIAGLPLEELRVSISPALDPDGLIAALPQLKELRMETGGGEITAVLTKLLASKRLSQLHRAAVANFEFNKPWTAEGTLEIRLWNLMGFDKHAQNVAVVPEGCVSKILIRPRSNDPWEQSGLAPDEPMIDALRAATKIPVEVAWY